MTPATGVLAPALTFVAVLAIAPVAGNPPNKGETIFAIPCAINSTFGLCLSPLILSDTTAENNDSIAPSIATVIAGDSRCSNSWGWSLGTAKCGDPLGIPPNRGPIVSIGK